MALLETVTNWVVIAGAVILFGVLGVGGWLAGYRGSKAAPVGSGRWIFALPAWAQIGGGLVISVLMAYLGYVLWIPLPLPVSFGATAILRVVGLAIFLAGWLLAVWARWALGAMWGVSTSFAAQLQPEHRLIERGPYAFARHPMYLGYWLLLAGLVLVYRTWAAGLLFVICLASFHRRARREEAALAERFGAEWQVYAVRVKFLIPFVW